MFWSFWSDTYIDSDWARYSSSWRWEWAVRDWCGTMARGPPQQCQGYIGPSCNTTHMIIRYGNNQVWSTCNRLTQTLWLFTAIVCTYFTQTRQILTNHVSTYWPMLFTLTLKLHNQAQVLLRRSLARTIVELFYIALHSTDCLREM